MTDHDPFLHAIVSQPDADAPRLIYADWLEEQGHAERAEFIRVQCELAAMKAKDVAAWDLARLQELEDREEELLELPAALGENPIREVARHCRYHRGFIEEATLSLGMFLFQAERALRWVPLRRLTLTHLEQQHLPFLAKTPMLSRLQGLTLRHEAREHQVLELRELLASPHLSALASLALANVLNRTLGHQPSFPVGPALQELQLSVIDLDPLDLENLLRSPMCRGLRKLRLQAMHYGWRFMPVLVQLLEALALEGITLDSTVSHHVTMTLRDTDLLLASPAMNNLRELRLTCDWMTEAAIKHLARSEHLRGLNTLALHSDGVNDSSLRALMRTEQLPRLQCLGLRGSSFEIIGIRTLANGPLLRQLRFLALDGRHLHRQALETLLHSRHWTGQTGLLLNQLPLTGQMLRDLRKKYHKTLPYCRVIQEMNEDYA
jgi:uncharacterized protein (TIGR02996 family)